MNKGVMTFVALEARVGRWAMLSNVFWFETVEAKPLYEYKITFVSKCLFFEVSAVCQAVSSATTGRTSGLSTCCVD